MNSRDICGKSDRYSWLLTIVTLAFVAYQIFAAVTLQQQMLPSQDEQAFLLSGYDLLQQDEQTYIVNPPGGKLLAVCMLPPNAHLPDRVIDHIAFRDEFIRGQEFVQKNHELIKHNLQLARLPFLLISLLTVALILFATGTRSWKRRWCVVVILWVGDAWILAQGCLIGTDVAATFAILGAALCASRAEEKRSWQYVAGASVFLTLGVLMKYTVLVALPVLSLLILRGRHNKRIGLAMALPLILVPLALLHAVMSNARVSPEHVEASLAEPTRTILSAFRLTRVLPPTAVTGLALQASHFQKESPVLVAGCRFNKCPPWYHMFLLSMRLSPSVLVIVFAGACASVRGLFLKAGRIPSTTLALGAVGFVLTVIHIGIKSDPLLRYLFPAIAAFFAIGASFLSMRLLAALAILQIVVIPVSPQGPTAVNLICASIFRDAGAFGVAELESSAVVLPRFDNAEYFGQNSAIAALLNPNVREISFDKLTEILTGDAHGTEGARPPIFVDWAYLNTRDQQFASDLLNNPLRSESMIGHESYGLVKLR